MGLRMEYPGKEAQRETKAAYTFGCRSLVSPKATFCTSQSGDPWAASPLIRTTTKGGWQPIVLAVEALDVGP